MLIVLMFLLSFFSMLFGFGMAANLYSKKNSAMKSKLNFERTENRNLELNYRLLKNIVGRENK